MKNLILIFVLMTSALGNSQDKFQKRELVSLDNISISYNDQRLFINIKNNNPIHFQIWKGNEMVLDASGIANGEESFPAIKGKFKFILLGGGKTTSKYFRI